MSLAQLLVEELVVHNLVAHDKYQIVKKLSLLMQDHGRITDAEAVQSALWEREKQRPFNVFGGVWLARVASLGVLDEAVAIARISKPVEAPDGDIEIVVFLVGTLPKSTRFLKLLAEISRTFSDRVFREKLMNCCNSVEMYDCLNSYY